MKKYSILLAAAFTLTPIHSAVATIQNKVNQDDETRQLVKFLVSDKLLIPGKYSKLVPLSYYVGTGDDVARYFGDYICKVNNTCDVTDSLYKDPFAILGKGLPPEQNGTDDDLLKAQAQIERTDMKYGADIYDAATWQIAIALAAKNGYLDKEKAQTLIAAQLENITHADNRATNEKFKYGYQHPITEAKHAFTFRMIATDFFNKDPFIAGKYKDNVRWDYNPEELAKNDPNKHDANFFKYTSTWSDWKPIIGENAWAQLLGPLQADYLANDGKISKATLDNALNTLDAFSAMQSGIGAFYYAPEGSEGNQGPIPQGEISLENNFSVLGSLQVFKQVLITMPSTPEIKKALDSINVMLYGGKTVNGFDTIGLLSFLYNGAYNAEKGVFYTHGTAADPKAQYGWKPDTSTEAGATAIDVNTWGMSALGVETVDAWFGQGTALKIWQNVRNNGGYFNNGTLWGVGYTLNNQQEKIMSTEWTAGAISAVHSLIDYYGKKSVNTTELQNDLQSMQQGIAHLRNDQYLNYDFDDATPKQYYVQVPESDGHAYLYASKRFAIPFGWNANTLPSTTSNAWVVMNKFKFNPFQFQGKLAGENYPTPAKKDIINGDAPPIGDTLPKDVAVNFTAGNLGQDGLVAVGISYSLKNPNPEWIPAGDAKKANGFKGIGKLAKGTKAISIAFNKAGSSEWYGACQIIPATKICKDSNCDALYTIETKWSANGRGDCDLK